MPGTLAPLQHVGDPRVQQNFDQIYLNWPPDRNVQTSLPTSPVVGQVIYFQTAAMAALTPALTWELLRTTAGWTPIGAVPLFTETDPFTTITAPDRTSPTPGYGALAVAGPVVVLPAPGWYDIEQGFSFYHSVAGTVIAMSYDIDATGAVDLDAAAAQAGVSNTDVQRVYRKVRKQFAAASTLTAKYRTAAAAGVFRGPRFLSATPVLL